MSHGRNPRWNNELHQTYYTKRFQPSDITARNTSTPHPHLARCHGKVVSPHCFSPELTSAGVDSEMGAGRSWQAGTAAADLVDLLESEAHWASMSWQLLCPVSPFPAHLLIPYNVSVWYRSMVISQLTFRHINKDNGNINSQ